MGKAKKNKLTTEKSQKSVPLSEQILEDKSVRQSGRTKSKDSATEKDFVGDKLSKKILDEARKQQEELQEEHGIQNQGSRQKTIKLGAAGADQSDSEGDWSEDEDGKQQYYEHVEVSQADEDALERFMSKNAPARRTLADIIQEKLTEKQTEIHSQMSDNASLRVEQMDDRVVNMYRQIRDILTKYRSGKLPKAFKIIPTMANWEQVLYLTEPDQWSAAAVYQATRIFSSNFNSKMAQRYYNLVLLPRVRDDIAEYKRLNFHLYMSLRKSLFKPAAFFKGVLLPLCESCTCTLREAVIVSSILAKNSIPVLHSSAAILKIAEMDYNGANSIFLRTLLDKKYALPYRVIDAVVFHFLGFERDTRELPVLWHQALLTFVQRYKQDISSEQKEALMPLLRKHSHPSITPEVRRELVNSKCRDEETAEPAMDM